MRYTHQMKTDVPAERLFDAITAINRWPEWDPDLDATTLDGPAEAGRRFTLKPKGGPLVQMMIEESQRPTGLIDLAFLPLARMRTRHCFRPVAGGTVVDIRIEIFGLLGFLWDRLIVRKQAAGLAAQTAAFVAFARDYQP